MKGKTLFPYLSDEPTMEENVIEGLAKILQLTYLMSIVEVAHPTRNRMEPVSFLSINDYPVLFSKHWTEFKNKSPLSTEKQFKTVQKEKIQNILTEITDKIPSFRADNRYLYTERYIEEYFCEQKEAKKERFKEPEAMVKAWIICFERLGNNDQLTDMQAIDKYTDIFKWGGSKERLRQLVVVAGKIRGSDGKKGNPSEKQIRDLGSAIKYMNNKEAIAKAKETYSKLNLL